LGTTAGPDKNLGEGVSDTASLSGTATQPASPVINLTGTGGAAAGGTITFKLYGPSASGCGTLVYTSDPVTVSGDGSYSTPNPQFAPTQQGTYHWVAEYSGNLPNTNATSHNAACTDADEDVVVNTVASSMNTGQTWVPNDSATISAPAGSGNLAGTATFTLYRSTDCTGTIVYGPVNRSVSGGSPQTVSTSNDTAVSATGNFSWSVSYDSSNGAQRDIPASCQETSSLTVSNGGTVSSP
jgi:hypothetical protein